MVESDRDAVPASRWSVFPARSPNRTCSSLWVTQGDAAPP